MDLLHAARAAYDEVDTFLNNLQQAEKRRDATIQSSFVGRPSAAPLKSSKALFSGQTWKDLVYACELERDDLKRFQGSAHDHERAAEVFNAACLQERQVVHDRRFAQALQEVDDDYWEKKGELIEDAFDPRTHLTHMEQPLITLIHAGFVRKRSENAGNHSTHQYSPGIYPTVLRADGRLISMLVVSFRFCRMWCSFG